MINPEAMAPRPVRERDLLPVSSDEQVIQYFQRQIENIRREVKSPIRAPHFRHINRLLHLSGEEEYSLMGGGYDSWSGESFPQLKAERGRAQDLLFKTMEAYGFDQTKLRPNRIYNYQNKRYEDDITVHADGTTREVLLYPSQTLKGLMFERVRDFVTETRENADV